MLDTSGGSRACSGLAVHRQNHEAAGAGPPPASFKTPSCPSQVHTPFRYRAHVPHSSPLCPLNWTCPFTVIFCSHNPVLPTSWLPSPGFPLPVAGPPVSPAVSSCVRQGLLLPAVVGGLAVAGAKVGGLAFCPLGDGAGGLPLGTEKQGPKAGSEYPEGRSSMGKGVGAGLGTDCGVGGKAAGAGSGDTPGAGGTVGKGNLGEKRGSSCSKAVGGAMGGKGGGGQGSKPGTLAGGG